MENNDRRTGVQTVSSNPGSSGVRTKKKKSRSRAAKLIRILKIALLVLVTALIGVIVTSLFVTKPDETDAEAYADDTFFEGITVNGHDVAGMTYDAARSLVLPDLEKTAALINITVKHDTTIWLLTAYDLGVTGAIDEALSDALIYGRNDSFVNNKKVQDGLLEHSVDFPVVFSADEAKLKSKVSVIAAALNTDPVDPGAEPEPWLDAPAFDYYNGKNGFIIDQEALCNEINALLASGQYNSTLDPELVETEPSHTVDWIKQNTVLRAQFQTEFGSSRSLHTESRVGNIQKATTLLNGAKVAVGEEFDFNEYIGPRTEKGGWPLAPGIVNGNTYELQAGGGICQVSTTLYNALLCCGPEVEIVERSHHSWPSSYADKGLDCTVSTGGKNLRFINNSGAPMYIFAYCDKENYVMSIYIYGEPLPDGVSYTTRGEVTETIEPEEVLVTENPEWPTGFEYVEITARTGYKAKAYRIKLVNGVETGEPELLYTDSYRAVQGKKTIGTGDPTLPEPTIN